MTKELAIKVAAARRALDRFEKRALGPAGPDESRKLTVDMGRAVRALLDTLDPRSKAAA